MIDGLFQPMHLLLIMGIALIVVGPGKISGVGASLGKSVHDFRKAMQESESEPTQVEPKDKAV